LATPKEFYDAVGAFNVETLAYAPSPGLPVLLDAIRKYYADIDVSLNPGDILVTTGGSEALLMTCLSILDPGSEVIIPEPFYPNYANFIRAVGANICPLPTYAEEGYRYAFKERIEAVINENTRAIIVNNPGNPTGVVLNQDEMRILADVAKEHDLYLISDEVYREFCYDASIGVPTFGCYDDIDDNLIIIDSVSKRFSACGARIGCVITKNKELQQAMLKLCQSRLSVATIDQIGAAALYDVDESFYQNCKNMYRNRRDVFIEHLRKIPGVVVAEPKGAFYLMASLPVDDTDKFQQWLLESFDLDGETVMFAPGAPFYASAGRGQNEVRLAYVLKEEDLIRAAEVLAAALERYRKEEM